MNRYTKKKPSYYLSPTRKGSSKKYTFRTGTEIDKILSQLTERGEKSQFIRKAIIFYDMHLHYNEQQEE